MYYAILIIDILSVVNVSRAHGCWHDTINDVGGNWSTQREAACRSERTPYPIAYQRTLIAGIEHGSQRWEACSLSTALFGTKEFLFNRFGMYRILNF